MKRKTKERVTEVEYVIDTLRALLASAREDIRVLQSRVRNLETRNGVPSAEELFSRIVSAQ